MQQVSEEVETDKWHTRLLPCQPARALSFRAIMRHDISSFHMTRYVLSLRSSKDQLSGHKVACNHKSKKRRFFYRRLYVDLLDDNANHQTGQTAFKCTRSSFIPLHSCLHVRDAYFISMPHVIKLLYPTSSARSR